MHDEIAAVDVIADREAFFNHFDTFFDDVVAPVDVKLERRVSLIEFDAVLLGEFLVRLEKLFQFVNAFRVKPREIAVADVAAGEVNVDVEIEIFKPRALYHFEVFLE